MTALHVQHPISYDQYDVCCMVKDKGLSKLKLGVLKLLCENLNISMPAAQRRKAPYISLLEDLVKTCSCSSDYLDSSPYVQVSLYTDLKRPK